MDVAERNKLVEQFIPLVYRISLDLLRKVPAVCRLGTTDDVASVGMFSLIRAAELYDPQHWSRAKFITYATTAIRNRIIQAAKCEGMIRLPWYIVDEMQELGRQSRKHRQARAAYACRITEQPPNVALEADESFDPDILYRVLSRLDARDRELAADYWGLGGGEPLTTRQLAAKCGVSRQQICNRLGDLKRRLRRDVEWELELERLPR